MANKSQRWSINSAELAFGEDPPTRLYANERTVLIDNSSPPPTRTRKCCCCTCSRKTCVCATVVSVVGGILLFLLLAILVLYLYAPYAIRGIVDDCEIEVNSIVFTDPGEDSVMIHAEITAHYPHVPLDATIIPGTFEFYYDNKYLGEVPCGNIQLQKGQTKAKVHINSRLSVDTDTFDAFGANLIENAEVEWRLKAKHKVSAKSSVIGIPLHFSDIDFDKTVRISGFAGLPNITMETFDVRTEPGLGGYGVIIVVNITLYNPSPIGISPAGSLNFTLSYEDAFLGTMFVPNASLVSGVNRLTLAGLLNPSNLTATDILFSRYFTNQSSMLTAAGATDGTASSIPLYCNVLQQLKLNAALTPSPTGGILVNADLVLNWEEWLHGLEEGTFIIPTELLIANPFSATVALTEVALDVTYHDIVVGGLHSQLDPYIEVTAKSSTLTAPLPVHIEPVEGILPVLEALGTEVFAGIVLLGVQGNFTMALGNLPGTVRYHQVVLPTCNFETYDKYCNQTSPSG